ncbi:hypothetical protein ACEPAG_5729 [Sanghuangporus baumii]
MARKPKEYEVERILKAVVSYKKGRAIHWKYYVKWKGYSDKRNTWEPEESFESSPQLIGKFWQKVDTGGRDINKASMFTLREELSPKDDTWTDEDGEGDDEEEEQKEGDGNESASAKTGTKRSAATPKVTPKRKRGRPSKAEKEANEAKKIQGAAESDAQEDAEDGDPTSERLSEKTSITKAAKSKFMTQIITITDSDSEDDENSVEKVIKRNAIREHPRKRRKVVIESDEEHEDSDTEISSHAGSLFSADESDEKEQIGRVEDTHPRILDTVASKSAGSQKLSPVPEQPKESKKPKILLNRLGRPTRRVKLIDDPAIEKAVEMRVHGHLYGQPSIATREKIPPPVPSSEKIPYKPTLLTFEKGKLTSHRSKATLPPLERTAPVTSAMLKSPVMDGDTQEFFSLLASPLDIAESNNAPEDGTVNDGIKVADVMDTTPDFPPANVVGSLESTGAMSPEKIETGPPPTAEELLRLSGAVLTDSELPDFGAEESIPAAPGMHDGVATSRRVYHLLLLYPAVGTENLDSIFEPGSSRSQRTASAPTTEETPSWKASGLFNIPTPLSILQRVAPSSRNEPQPPPKPEKLVISLRLGLNSIVPVILKDTWRATVGPTMKELLKPGQIEGPPGRFFPKGTFKFGAVASPCSSARLAPDEDCSDEQHSWFTKFADELANGGLFYIKIGVHHFLLCSSENFDAGYSLMLPSQNLGLRRAVLMAFAPIWNKELYDSFAMNGQEFPL